jgi:hypothetical protein
VARMVLLIKLLTRLYPGNEFVSFLIVEGYTDSNLFKRFINKDKCQISVADSKSNALQVLSILDGAGFRGTLAIVDADFDLLENDIS